VPVVALVHEEELFNELPLEPHDRKVNWVSTCLGLHEVDI
jgi:5-formyltetrahydrofolate cyclo-ligase